MKSLEELAAVLATEIADYINNSDDDEWTTTDIAEMILEQIRASLPATEEAWEKQIGEWRLEYTMRDDRNMSVERFLARELVASGATPPAETATCEWRWTPTSLRIDAKTGCGHEIGAVDEFPPACPYCKRIVEQEAAHE